MNQSSLLPIYPNRFAAQRGPRLASGGAHTLFGRLGIVILAVFGCFVVLAFALVAHVATQGWPLTVGPGGGGDRLLAIGHAGSGQNSGSTRNGGAQAPAGPAGTVSDSSLGDGGAGVTGAGDGQSGPRSVAVSDKPAQGPAGSGQGPGQLAPSAGTVATGPQVSAPAQSPVQNPQPPGGGASPAVVTPPSDAHPGNPGNPGNDYGGEGHPAPSPPQQWSPKPTQQWNPKPAKPAKQAKSKPAATPAPAPPATAGKGKGKSSKKYK
jgi:hypothetical protein